MRDGEASHTASWVAFLRGFASLGASPASRDPYAARLLAWPYALPLRLGRAFPRVGRALCAAQDLVDGGRMRHFELRTAAIDAVLLAFAARHPGAVLVILGAGFDARAFRLHDAFQKVIEIDHPATQAIKRARIERAGLPAGRIAFAPCDFSAGALDDVLKRHVPVDHPVAVVWEGVTMYIDATHVDESLLALRDSLAPSSLLAVTYLAEKPSRTLEHAVRWAGEQFRFFEGSSLFSLRLERHHFRPIEDSGDAEWNRHFLQRPTRAGRGLAERLAVACRE